MLVIMIKAKRFVSKNNLTVFIFMVCYDLSIKLVSFGIQHITQYNV